MKYHVFRFIIIGVLTLGFCGISLSKSSAQKYGEDSLTISVEEIVEQLPPVIMQNIADSITMYIGKAEWWVNPDYLLVRFPITDDSMTFIYAAKQRNYPEGPLQLFVSKFTTGYSNLLGLSIDVPNGRQYWLNLQNWTVYGVHHHIAGGVSEYMEPIELADPGWQQCVFDEEMITFDANNRIIVTDPDDRDTTGSSVFLKGPGGKKIPCPKSVTGDGKTGLGRFLDAIGGMFVGAGDWLGGGGSGGPAAAGNWWPGDPGPPYGWGTGNNGLPDDPGGSWGSGWGSPTPTPPSPKKVNIWDIDPIHYNAISRPIDSRPPMTSHGVQVIDIYDAVNMMAMGAVDDAGSKLHPTIIDGKKVYPIPSNGLVAVAGNNYNLRAFEQFFVDYAKMFPVTQDIQFPGEIIHVTPSRDVRDENGNPTKIYAEVESYLTKINNVITTGPNVVPSRTGTSGLFNKVYEQDRFMPANSLSITIHTHRAATFQVLNDLGHYRRLEGPPAKPTFPNDYISQYETSVLRNVIVDDLYIMLVYKTPEETIIFKR